MPTCLVTKLNAISSNQNLPKWREIELMEIKNSGTQSTQFKLANNSGEKITVSCDENGTFENGQRVVEIVGGDGLITMGTLTGDTKISVSPYSDLTTVITGKSSASSGTGKDQYFVNIQQLLQKLPILKDISYRYPGTLSVFSMATQLETLGLQNSADFDSENAKKIELLGALVNLIYLYTKSSDITGALEDLADAQVSAGRTSGSLLVQCNDHITLGGVVVGNVVYKTITFNSSSPGGYTIS